MENHNTCLPLSQNSSLKSVLFVPCKEKTMRTKIREPRKQKKYPRNQDYISDWWRKQWWLKRSRQKQISMVLNGRNPQGNLTTFLNIYWKPWVTVGVFESVLKGIQMITRLPSWLNRWIFRKRVNKSQLSMFINKILN